MKSSITYADVVRRLIGQRIVQIDGGFWDAEHGELCQPVLYLSSGDCLEIGDEAIQLKTVDGLDVEWP